MVGVLRRTQFGLLVVRIDGVTALLDIRCDYAQALLQMAIRVDNLAIIALPYKNIDSRNCQLILLSELLPVGRTPALPASYRMQLRTHCTLEHRSRYGRTGSR